MQCITNAQTKILCYCCAAEHQCWAKHVNKSFLRGKTLLTIPNLRSIPDTPVSLDQFPDWSHSPTLEAYPDKRSVYHEKTELIELFRVTTLQTLWNSLTFPWQCAALVPMLSGTH